MRRLISYLISAFALVCAASCIQEGAEPIVKDNVMTIKLRNTELVATRAEAVEALNENLINTVQCFFSTDGENIIYSTKHISVSQHDTGEGIDFPVEIPADVLNDQLYPDYDNDATKNTCKIYVLANAPEVASTATTITQVKTLAISLDTTAEDEKTSIDLPQDSFVMDGESVVERNGNDLSGEIRLTRAAAKIIIDINVKNPVELDGVTWTPNTSAIDLQYHNIVTESKVAAKAASASARVNVNDLDPTDGFTFYSYPSQWEEKSETEAYVSLTIPWKRSTDTDYTKFAYYRFPVNNVDKNILRNHVYKLTIDINALGHLGQMDIEPSYEILDWNAYAIDVELARPRYLVVDENEVNAYNREEYAIGFHSSDEVEVILDSIVFDSYRLAKSRRVKLTPGGEDGIFTFKPALPDGDNKAAEAMMKSLHDKFSDYKVEVENIGGTHGGYIRFSHKITERMIAPHSIHITVNHKGDDTGAFLDHIVITQYPSIYIEAERSNGYVFVNGYDNDYSHRMVDEAYLDQDDDDIHYIGYLISRNELMDSDGLTAANYNGNNYNIYVTSLPSTSSSIIGDPREKTGITLNGISGLTNYRKTRRDASNIIAPAFKIASSRAKSESMFFEGAEKRCASYQESGFPMGRWRVPTEAEILFMQERVINYEVPSLFNMLEMNGYFSANGTMFITQTQGNDHWTALPAGFYDYTQDEVNSMNTVRCVYDIWYWGKDPVEAASQKAVWGDVLEPGEEPEEIEFSVVQDTFTFSASGKDYRHITIRGLEEWEIVDEPSWISIANSSGYGYGNTWFHATVNTSTESREAQFKVISKTSSEEIIITVTQEGKES